MRLSNRIRNSLENPNPAYSSEGTEMEVLTSGADSYDLKARPPGPSYAATVCRESTNAEARDRNDVTAGFILRISGTKLMKIPDRYRKQGIKYLLPSYVASERYTIRNNFVIFADRKHRPSGPQSHRR